MTKKEFVNAVNYKRIYAAYILARVGFEEAKSIRAQHLHIFMQSFVWNKGV